MKTFKFKGTKYLTTEFSEVETYKDHDGDIKIRVDTYITSGDEVDEFIEIFKDIKKKFNKCEKSF